ncbi:MAG: PEGA domain-containing protein [Myxococcota bacterium]|nr:PEGA domain-containing protein [Myxococcota bacterium]
MIRCLQIISLGSVIALLQASVLPGIGRANPNAMSGKVIGILPIANNQDVNEYLNQAVRGYEGLKVVSLTRIDDILGPGTNKLLRACKSDDQCRREALAGLRLDYFIAGEISSTARGSNLRLRLVQINNASQNLSKITVNANISDEEVQTLKLAVIDAVSSLFGESGLLAFGTIEIRTNSEGASVILNDQNLGISPLPPIRVPAGSHRLKIEKKGFRPWFGSVEVLLGEAAVYDAQLEKNRSTLPLYLGGGAISAAITGLIFGLHATQIANGWDTACASNVCGEGYSSERYRDETRLVDIERNVANGFFSVAVGLGISALVTYILDEGVDSSSEGVAP